MPCPVNAMSCQCHVPACRPLQQGDTVLTAGAFTALGLDRCLYQVQGTGEHSARVGLFTSPFFFQSVFHRFMLEKWEH